MSGSLLLDCLACGGSREKERGGVGVMFDLVHVW